MLTRLLLTFALLTFALTLTAAISPSALGQLSPAQSTQADDLETDLDARLTAQFDPGETVFTLTPANDSLDNDALVRAEVASRYVAAGWTTAVWQNLGGTTNHLILIE